MTLARQFLALRDRFLRLRMCPSQTPVDIGAVGKTESEIAPPDWELVTSCAWGAALVWQATDAKVHLALPENIFVGLDGESRGGDTIAWAHRWNTICNQLQRVWPNELPKNINVARSRPSQIRGVRSLCLRYRDDWKTRIENYALVCEFLAAKSAETDTGHRTEGIPPQFRTKPLAYSEVGKLLGFRGSKDKARQWVKQCIADGTLKFQEGTRKLHYFDIRDFPESTLARIRPNSA